MLVYMVSISIILFCITIIRRIIILFIIKLHNAASHTAEDDLPCFKVRAWGLGSKRQTLNLLPIGFVCSSNFISPV